MRVGVCRIAACSIALILVTLLGLEWIVAPARAQAVPKAVSQGGTDVEMRVRKNAWTVAVAGGQLSGTYMTFANELAQVLDDGDNMRVLPIVTYGAASNLDDLLYLVNFDVAITQSDVFEYFRKQRKIANLESRINYILRLPVSEMHVLARSDVAALEDLKGKKVSFGPAGSASSLTGSIVFQRLGIEVEQVFFDNPTALQKLKTGELAALVRVIGKPIDFFSHVPANSGLHLVPIPFSSKLADTYALGELTHKDYPTLVRDGATVDTIAVPAVLAVADAPRGSDRFRRVQRFVENLFTKWDKFREPPRHPKWRDINLAASVPGWTRWAPADEMLKRIRPVEVAHGSGLSEAQRDALFREFLRWQEKGHRSELR
jgi:TRAP transporter TAXI family solute receptor